MFFCPSSIFFCTTLFGIAGFFVKIMQGKGFVCFIQICIMFQFRWSIGSWNIGIGFGIFLNCFFVFFSDTGVWMEGKPRGRIVFLRTNPCNKIMFFFNKFLLILVFVWWLIKTLEKLLNEINDSSDES